MAAGDVCLIADCDRVLTGRGEGKGMCSKHYLRLRRHGDPNYQAPPKTPRSECAVVGCGKVAKARIWCTKHYTRWLRHGDPAARLPGEVVNGQKICNQCGEDQPLSAYSRSQDPQCRSCAAQRMAQWRAAHPGRNLVREPMICQTCGATYLGNGKKRRNCSEACRIEQKRIDNRNLWTPLYRARLRAAKRADFTAEQIFERDNWFCMLCEQPVDRTLKRPDLMSVSLDHIVPLSRGGLHEPSNVQTTHLLCNMQKGARLTA